MEGRGMGRRQGEGPAALKSLRMVGPVVNGVPPGFILEENLHRRTSTDQWGATLRDTVIVIVSC